MGLSKLSVQIRQCITHNFLVFSFLFFVLYKVTFANIDNIFYIKYYIKYIKYHKNISFSTKPTKIDARSIENGNRQPS
jgi:hypothetical protein